MKLVEHQQQVQTQDKTETILVPSSDYVWLSNKRTSEHKCSKFLPRFIDPFLILRDGDNHIISSNEPGGR